MRAKGADRLVFGYDELDEERWPAEQEPEHVEARGLAQGHRAAWGSIHLGTRHDWG